MASGSQPNLQSFVPQHPHQAVFGSWKRAIIFGLAFGVGTALTLVGVGVGIVKYRDRTTPVHAWSDIDFPQIGIRVSLKTEAREGSAKYQFTVVPSSEKYENAFDEVASKTDTSGAFTIFFYDKSGFQRCREALDALTPIVNDHGKFFRLDGNGTFLGCSTSDYIEATSWTLGYKFPDLKTIRSTDTTPSHEGIDISAGFIPKAPKQPGQKDDQNGEDSITGVAFTDGHLDTKDHIFHVSREGEKISLASWLPAQHIHYDCKAKSCLIENTDNNQVLHATMIR